MRVQIETLKRIAYGGAAFTVASTVGMYYYMQNLLCKGDYYVKSLQLAKSNPVLKEALGYNLNQWKLQLWDTRNVVNPDSAYVVIPIWGERAKGALHVTATRPLPDLQHPGQWQIDKMRLEVLSPERKTIHLDPSADAETLQG
eukprot:m.53813 g.53813  ORF g.53813 m.53813 type:complete len:143 (-) comp13198_c0_seq1:257-685(-)